VGEASVFSRCSGKWKLHTVAADVDDAPERRPVFAWPNGQGGNSPQG
jgi:hypothetical protein